MGKFSAGHAPNIIPQEAVIEGTIRTFDRDVTALILRRIGEIADATARAFRGSASVEELASAPPLKNDEALTEQMARCAEMLFGEKSVYRLREGGMGSEDFASYTYELPCAYLLLGAARRRRTRATESPCTTRASSSTRTFYRAGAHCSPMARCSGSKTGNKKIRLRIS